MTDEAELREYVRRVESLRPHDRLTTGLDLDDTQRALVEAEIAGVERGGFAIVPGFVGTDRLQEIRRAMEPIFELTTSRDASRKGRYTGIQTVHVHNLFAKTRAVDEIAIDPLLRST